MSGDRIGDHPWVACPRLRGHGRAARASIPSLPTSSWACHPGGLEASHPSRSILPGSRAILTTVAALLIAAGWFAGTRAAQEPAPAGRGGATASPGAGKDDATRAPAKAKAKAKASAKARGRARRDPPGFYMGRPIADVMSWEGADWLFRETRIEE